ncbi:hypothetical protein [Spirosoma pomorum]
MKTIDQLTPTEEELLNPGYNYQKELTVKLDDLDDVFTQETINEIVLWKVNRYVALDDGTLSIFNLINKSDSTINIELTREILGCLLQQKGIRLPMASTMLRFKNPAIYQIIDQRVYRFVYGEELPYSTNVKKQIDLYLDYLKRLKESCNLRNIPFELSDRILYSMDKVHNPDLKLKGYGL